MSVKHRKEEICEIEWPSLQDNMSNSEPLSLICVIVCCQSFGCLLSVIEALFTFPKIIFLAFLLHNLKIVTIKNSSD